MFSKFTSFVFQKRFFLFLALFFSSTFLVAQGQSESSAKNIFVDSDQDNLSFEEEKLYGTNPNLADTDSDGYSDGVEIESGYNPLLPAPGDRIVKPKSVAVEEYPTNQKNLTNEVSEQIAGVLSNVTEENKELSFDEINTAVEKAIGGESEELILPEVDIKEIKIKKAPSSKLKEKERLQEEKKDVLEYLTVMSYIMASNSPTQFKTEDELGSVLGNLSNQAILGLTNGNTEFTKSLAERGQKILDESKKVEVPESMVDIHIKALKMGLYAASLKDELRPDGEDPLGQIGVLSRMQALLTVADQFTDEVQDAVEKYEITDIPLEL
jgi:Bacterial TSP3 repeat